jgi:hypothetical protein
MIGCQRVYVRQTTEYARPRRWLGSSVVQIAGSGRVTGSPENCTVTQNREPSTSSGQALGHHLWWWSDVCPPAHRDRAAMNGRQLLIAHGDSDDRATHFLSAGQRVRHPPSKSSSGAVSGLPTTHQQCRFEDRESSFLRSERGWIHAYSAGVTLTPLMRIQRPMANSKGI